MLSSDRAVVNVREFRENFLCVHLEARRGPISAPAPHWRHGFPFRRHCGERAGVEGTKRATMWPPHPHLVLCACVVHLDSFGRWLARTDTGTSRGRMRPAHSGIRPILEFLFGKRNTHRSTDERLE